MFPSRYYVGTYMYVQEGFGLQTPERKTDCEIVGDIGNG